MLRLEVAGRPVYLEPDLIAFQLRGRFHVVEIKSFAVIDGQADGEKVAAAAMQSAVYVLALRDLLAELGTGPEAVADTVVLVCPENFSNQPTAALLDVRKQLTVLRRQLARLTRIDALLDALPPELTFDLDLDAGRRAAPAARRAGRRGADGRPPGTRRSAWRPARCASSAATRPAAARRRSAARSARTSAASTGRHRARPGRRHAAARRRPGRDRRRCCGRAARLRRECLGRCRMSTLTALARAQAVAGRRAAGQHGPAPAPHRRPLVLIPLTLAGEAAAPLAAMAGDGPDSGRLLVVGQPAQPGPAVRVRRRAGRGRLGYIERYREPG